MDANAILDTAREHFGRLRGQKIEIPEWGMVDDKAGTYDPPTLKIRQMIQHRAGKSEARQMALVMILCLKDHDGAKVFRDDVPTLAALEADVDPRVVAQAAQKILGLTDADALGN